MDREINNEELFKIFNFVSKAKIMKTAKLENMIIEGYLALLSGLSDSGKKLLIKRLNAMVHPTEKSPDKDFYEAFGAWQGEETAEELIENIRNSRKETPVRVEF